MTGRPAATLLHLGPGLGNGMANLHNARKARTPLLNIVGDHATYHTRYDAQLQSDIETVARNVSPGWVRTSQSLERLTTDAAEAIAATQGPPGQVATLILPADLCWSDGAEPAPAIEPQGAGPAEDAVIGSVVEALRSAGSRTALLLGGRALREPALRDAARVAAATGARLIAEVFPTRIERGAGLPAIDRLAYLPELASIQLSGIKHLVLLDAASPVTFFAYPGLDSDLVPDRCTVHELAVGPVDAAQALAAVVEGLGVESTDPRLQVAARPPMPSGSLTAEKVCQIVGAQLPEGAIVSDEAQTSGLTLPASTAGAPRHDLLALTGGAIGQGLPVAVGAAIACPDRPVLALEADGSSLYTFQSLWTMAREGLDVTVVLFDNSSYGILNLELARVGARGDGPKAKAQLDLGDPGIDFVSLAKGLGVPAQRAASCEELAAALEGAFAEPGPHLIEATVPPAFSPRQLRAIPRALRVLGALPSPVGRAVKRRVFP